LLVLLIWQPSQKYPATGNYSKIRLDMEGAFAVADTGFVVALLNSFDINIKM
jgi:hypothetical protein